MSCERISDPISHFSPTERYPDTAGRSSIIDIYRQWNKWHSPRVLKKQIAHYDVIVWYLWIVFTPTPGAKIFDVIFSLECGSYFKKTVLYITPCHILRKNDIWHILRPLDMPGVGINWVTCQMVGTALTQCYDLSLLLWFYYLVLDFGISHSFASQGR